MLHSLLQATPLVSNFPHWGDFPDLWPFPVSFFSFSLLLWLQTASALIVLSSSCLLPCPQTYSLSHPLVKILTSFRHKVDPVWFTSDISCKKSSSLLFQRISKLQCVQNVLPYLSCQCMTWDSNQRHQLLLICVGNSASCWRNLTNCHKFFMTNLHCLCILLL